MNDGEIDDMVNDIIECNAKHSISEDIRWLEEHGFEKFVDDGRIMYINRAFCFKGECFNLVCGKERRCDYRWTCRCWAVQKNDTRKSLNRLIDDMFRRISTDMIIEDFSSAAFVINSTRLNVVRMRFLEWMNDWMSSSGFDHSWEAVANWCEQLADVLERVEMEFRSHPPKYWNEEYIGK